MQADTEDRYIEQRGKSGLPTGPILVVVLLAAAAAGWYFTRETAEAPPPPPPPQAVAPEPAPAPMPEQPPAADIPEVPPAPAPEPVAEPDPNIAVEPVAPALTLDNSDEPIRSAVTTADANGLLDAALAQDHLVERGTAVIDTLSRGLVMPKLLPLPPPKGKFSVIEVAGKTVIDPDSYSRYDSQARSIAALETDVLVASFHLFRPLLEQAYGALGYPADELDNAIIRSLDRIIAAPKLEEPIAVEKAVAAYKFVDEDLEALDSLQKQLIRMGPENTALIQEQASALRRALLAQP